jgi:hypothetical protein
MQTAIDKAIDSLLPDLHLARDVRKRPQSS